MTLIGFILACLTLSFCCFAGLFLFLLFGLLAKVRDYNKRKHHRSHQPALADLLNYASLIDDGILVCKSGALMASWIYEGEDDAGHSDAQKNNVSFRVNKALSSLGSGWALHVDAVRRPSPGYSSREASFFPDPVSAAIDEERRHLFESIGTLYESYFVLTITWFPPLLAQRRFIEMMFDDEEKPKESKGRTKALLDQFRRDIETLEGRLSSVIELTRLKARTIATEDGKTVVVEDFLSWLRFCVTGIHAPVLLPSNPSWLDSLLGVQETWGGVIPRTGKYFIQTVAIDGFPMESTQGILSALSEIACDYRWSSRFIFMDQHEAVHHLDRYRKKWRQKVRGFFDQVFNTNTGPIDQDALFMMNDAEVAIAEVNSGYLGIGYYTSVVVLMDENREKLQAMSALVERVISSLGFGARIETINTFDSWMGSLPGHVVENVRRPLLSTLNLADLLPLNTIWMGKNFAPCPFYPTDAPALMQCVTSGSTPFRLNLHVRDLGHSFIFGPTGAGKSTHLAILAAQMLRYKAMSIYAFDKGLSLYPLTKAVGGNHVSCGADDGSLSFCPLGFLETRGDRAWALEWIETILQLNGVTPTPAIRNAVSEALESMQASRARTLSEFCVTLQDEQVREALRQYTVDGAMGYLMDAEQDGLSLSSFNTFEIEDLMNLGEKFALPVLLYLFRRIERSLLGQPAAILLDEAWIMLGHPVFRDKIREWLKVMRKANCLVLMATQSISDASNSGILDVIMESCATKIFLPNIHARDEDTALLYRRMGLNARQIAILASAIPKRHYYYVSESGRRLYELSLGPLAMALTATSDKESLATIRSLEEKYGPHWCEAWLNMRGISLSHYSRSFAHVRREAS